jgi:hypothetical protein
MVKAVPTPLNVASVPEPPSLFSPTLISQFMFLPLNGTVTAPLPGHSTELRAVVGWRRRRRRGGGPSSREKGASSLFPISSRWQLHGIGVGRDLRRQWRWRQYGGRPKGFGGDAMCRAGAQFGGGYSLVRNRSRHIFSNGAPDKKIEFVSRPTTRRMQELETANLGVIDVGGEGLAGNPAHSLLRSPFLRVVDISPWPRSSASPPPRSGAGRRRKRTPKHASFPPRGPRLPATKFAAARGREVAPVPDGHCSLRSIGWTSRSGECGRYQPPARAHRSWDEDEGDGGCRDSAGSTPTVSARSCRRRATRRRGRRQVWQVCSLLPHDLGQIIFSYASSVASRCSTMHRHTAHAVVVLLCAETRYVDICWPAATYPSCCQRPPSRAPPFHLAAVDDLPNKPLLVSPYSPPCNFAKQFFCLMLNLNRQTV